MLRIYSRDQCSSCLTSVWTGRLRSSTILSSGREWGSSRCSWERLEMLPIEELIEMELITQAFINWVGNAHYFGGRDFNAMFNGFNCL